MSIYAGPPGRPVGSRTGGPPPGGSRAGGPQPGGRPGMMGPGRSALPYDVLAGVEPCARGWLVVPGNLQGVTMAPQPSLVLASLAEVLDYRPSFAVVALHAPIGVPEKPGDQRVCDRVARGRLGVRGAAAVPAPSRALLGARTLDEARAIDPHVDIVRWGTLRRAAEAIREVPSWRQRLVWEVNPELAFQTMADGHPLRHGRRTIHGVNERLALLEARLPGTERVLAGRPADVEEWRLLAACADLWMARRIKARAITRLADPPEWDAEGVRMDIVC